MTAVALRAAAPGDFAAVTALLQAAGLPLAGVPPTLERFVVAEREGALVGVAGLEQYARTALLRSVAVAERERGSGVGRALVERVLADARVAGVRDLYLLTTTADRWFPRLGFRWIERAALPSALASSEELRGACPASAVAMHRPLFDAGCLRVLFICTGNSARSQIAEALLNAWGGGRFLADSAGARPAERVHPMAVEVLRGAGIEWRGHVPRGIDEVAAREWDLVVTVCDHAREVCPVLPGQPAMAHWSLPDPAGASGTVAERRRAFLDVFALVRDRIGAMMALPVEALDRPTLARRVTELGPAAAAR
jgi:protein-tyrosine-phosphatase/N-acetylglutamate synthase-like GNAT family acetyltransferase